MRIIVALITLLLALLCIDAARAQPIGEWDPFSIHLDGSNDSSISANILFPQGITVADNVQIYIGDESSGSGLNGVGYIQILDTGFSRFFALGAAGTLTGPGLSFFIDGGDAGQAGQSGGDATVTGGGAGAGGTGGNFNMLGGSGNGGNNGYVRVGTGGAPSRFTLSSSNTRSSLFVRRDLEVDGTTWLDGNALVGGTLNVTGATTLATSLTGILKGTSGLVATASSADILAAIDFGTVMLKTDAGVTTFYEPSADTDAARGTALATAIAAHAAGDTIVVGPGTYDLTDDFTLLAGASLIGVGQPTLYCDDLTDKPLVRLVNSNVRVENIDLETNLAGLGEFSATPIAISGVVIRNVTHTPTTTTNVSGLQFAESVGGGTTEHEVQIDVYSSRLHGGTILGYGVQMNLADDSVVNLWDCDVYGATDGLLNKTATGTSTGVTNIYGGKYASVLDAITSGGGTSNVINVYGATARGDQADLYGDDGRLNAYFTDARGDYIQGNGINQTTQSNTVGFHNIIAGQLTFADFGAAADAGIKRVGASALQVTNSSSSRGDLEVADEAYDSTAWNGSFETPTKNALRDQLVLVPLLAGANTWTGTNLFTNTLTVGVDGTGHDVKLFGDTSGAYAEWDADTSLFTIVGDGTQRSLDVRGNTRITGTGGTPVNSPYDLSVQGANLWGYLEILNNTSGLDHGFFFGSFYQSASREDAELWSYGGSNKTSGDYPVITYAGWGSNMVAYNDRLRHSWYTSSSGSPGEKFRVDISEVKSYTNFKIGNSVAATDYVLTFDGQTSDQTITGMEDEDRLDFSDDALWPDNECTQYGTGVDASICYNATNLVINPKVVGTGYLDVLGNVSIGDNSSSNQILTFNSSVTDATLTFLPGSGYFVVDSPGGAATGGLMIAGLDKLYLNDTSNYLVSENSGDVGIYASANVAVHNPVVLSSTLVSAATGALGWAVVDGTDNTACTAQCTGAAVFGFNLAAGATAPVLVGAADTTADICVCANSS